MLRQRTEIVKNLIGASFEQSTELEKRRLESMCLQILAVLYAPPRTTTPVDMDNLLDCVKASKAQIDKLEARKTLDAYPICQLNISDTDSRPPSAEFNVVNARCSPIPLRLTRDGNNDIVMEEMHPTFVHRPTPRRPGGTILKPA